MKQWPVQFQSTARFFIVCLATTQTCKYSDSTAITVQYFYSGAVLSTSLVHCMFVITIGKTYNVSVTAEVLADAAVVAV